MPLPVPDRVQRASQRLLPVVALAYVAGTLLQVYLAGRSTLGAAMWGDHVALGHALSLPAALTVLLAYLGASRRRVRWLAWLTFATYYATIALAFLRGSANLAALAPLHPVLAVATVLLGVLLAAEAYGLRLVRGDGREAPPEPEA